MKKTFVLRLDETTFEALEKWAADEFRSVNGQLEWLIAQALKDAGRWPKEKKLTEVKETKQEDNIENIRPGKPRKGKTP